MMKINPKISIVMSVYNEEKYLREAIESILNQTYKDFEFIIIDDGSTDKSAHIIKSYNDPRIVLIQQNNTGLSPALNTGIKAAKGKYIARMDADDISHIDRLKYQITYMEKHKDCVALGTKAMIIDKDGNYIYSVNNKFSKEQLRKQLPANNPFFHGSMIMRKEALLKCGGYKEEALGNDEDLLWIDLQKQGEMDILNEPLYSYRICPTAGSISSKKWRRKLREIRIEYYFTGKINKGKGEEAKKIQNSFLENNRLKKSSYHYRIGCLYFTHSVDFYQARKHFYNSVKFNITNLRAWFYLLISCCPKWVIYRLKKYRIRMKSKFFKSLKLNY